MFYVADERCVLMCQLCGVGFNSAKQAESHYVGQKHRTREAELQAVQPSVVPFRTCNLDYDITLPYSNDFLHINSCMSVLFIIFYFS